MCRRMVVIDTGAGLNFIANSAIPPSSDEDISLQPNIQVKSGNGNTLGIEGQVSLVVRVGTAVMGLFLSVRLFDG